MAHEEKLPWELIEEILTRVPARSLVRFRTVSKQWNTLFNDKTFINNHKTTFRFILATKSKIYSVSINPKIEVRELTLDIPGLESKIPNKLVDFNGFMFCGMNKETLIWNPWLNQTRPIKLDVDQLQVSGIVYDDDTRSYKTLAYCRKSHSTSWKIGDFDSDVWESESHTSSQGGENSITLASKSVSLHGNLYWIASHTNVSMFRVVLFDFSTESFQRYCDLPCGDNHHHDALALSVFKEDRFSLLKQSYLSNKIKIWVSKNKIRRLYGGDVEWMNIMEVSSPNLPYLHPEPSYFIDDDKRLVVCSCDETGQAWIDVFGDNKLISETKLDLVVDPWPLHCTFFPSLVSVPRGRKEEMEKRGFAKKIKGMNSWIVFGFLILAFSFGFVVSRK